MNASDLWPAIARIEAAYSLQLTQALIHFLWQGCVIAALYAAAMFALRRSSAAARHLAGAAALLLMAACLPVTLCLLPSPQPNETKLAQADEGSSDTLLPLGASKEELAVEVDFLGNRSEMGATAGLSSSAFPGNMPRSTAEQAGGGTQAILSWLSPYASAIYLFGVILMLGRVSLGVWGVGRLRRICTPVTDGAALQLVRDCARRMALRAVPVVAHCRRISTPMAVGILRPTILLPAALASGLTPTQLQAILLHEMAHLRRYDLIVNILQRLVEAMMFFHPAVWWISRRVSIERENACDDLATLAGEERVQYADALLRAAELCAAARSIDARRAASLAATGENASQFGDRLRRLLGQNDRPKFRLTIAGAAASVLLVVALLLMPTILRGAGGACDKVADEKPVSMSADDFMRLTPTEQRDLLVRVFQHRLKQADNLYFHTEQIGKVRKNNNGIPGEPIDGKPDSRWVYRHWRLNDSCRMVTESFQKPDDAEPNYRSSYGVNADEGLARCLTILREGGKTPPTGQVLYPQNPDNNNLYIYWLDRKFPQPKEFASSTGEPLFQNILRHKDAFKIEPVGELIRLSVSWQPWWAEKPSGTQVCLLDPRKGYLPVKCETQWDEKTDDGKPIWGKASHTVKKCRLVGEVWMPLKISLRSEISFAPEEIYICEINVLQIEYGKVKSADLMVPFSEGMEITDSVKRVKYTADAEGKPTGPIENAPRYKETPPNWWLKRYGNVKRGVGGYSLASRLSPNDQNALDAANDQIERDKLERREKLEALLKKLKSLPCEAVDERIEIALEILRNHTVTENTPIWAYAIRELITIGKPAVPALTEELDRTENDMPMRALGFALRGIGDPRAVPALIRAIPRTINFISSDCGCKVDNDPALDRFMLDHASGQRKDDPYFGYHRPIGETMTALKKLTKQSFGWQEIKRVYLEGGIQQRRVMQTQALDHARIWADWWRRNWHEFLDVEAEAQLSQIDKSLNNFAETIPASPTGSLRSDFPRGPDVVESNLIRTFSRGRAKWPPQGELLDLDSGRRPKPPKNLIEESPDGVPSKSLLAWAERVGVDLIVVKHTPPDGKKPYIALMPLGMKVWRIDNHRFASFVNELRKKEKLSLPEQWEGLIAQTDPNTCEYDQWHPASYLFITKEGVCGIMQLKDKLHWKYFYKRDKAAHREEMKIPSNPNKETVAPSEIFMSTGDLESDPYLKRKNIHNDINQAINNGASKASERAVSKALEWLAKHQLKDGGWSFDLEKCPGCEGKCRNSGSYGEARIAATGLALLPFLGAGDTHKNEGPYQSAIQAGLKFLVDNIQKSDHGGKLYEPEGKMYSHGIGTISLCEAYGMTKDPDLLSPARETLKFICHAQDPDGGGWRYTPRQKGDTSVVGWQLTALRSGHAAGFEIPFKVVERTSNFLDGVQSNDGAAYGYLTPGEGEATTAAGLLCRIYLGWDRDNPALKCGVQLLGKRGPSPTNMYYNYYATQVMQYWGGELWENWNRRMRDQLVQSQAAQDHEAGSWFTGSGDLGSATGGRLYCTSMATMILEAYYRSMFVNTAEKSD